MEEFKSWRDFRKFYRIIQEFRYVRPKEIDEFLQVVLSTSKKRETIIPNGRIFWRAQIGCNYIPFFDDDGVYVDDEPYQYDAKRMKPLHGKSVEGRINPKGISYLYLSTQQDTALSEVRPWVGALVSVAIFETIRELKVIDCSGTENHHPLYIKEPDPQEREQAVWSDIDRAFSKPVIPTDRTAEYVPTQVIAELFKVAGFDGIVYKSVFYDGYNLALFDLDAAEMVSCSLDEIKDIKFINTMYKPPYYVKKNYENKSNATT